MARTDAHQAMTQHRNSISIQIKAQDTPRLKLCADDKSLRVMVFCGAEENGAQDIAFPHQSEMKINGDEVKANLRGLKNKPGSTRPVDITDLLRLKLPAYSNSIEFTYALTKNAGDRSHSSQVRFPCHAVPCPGHAREVGFKKAQADFFFRPRNSGWSSTSARRFMWRSSYATSPGIRSLRLLSSTSVSSPTCVLHKNEPQILTTQNSDEGSPR